MGLMHAIDALKLWAIIMIMDDLEACVLSNKSKKRRDEVQFSFYRLAKGMIIVLQNAMLRYFRLHIAREFSINHVNWNVCYDLKGELLCWVGMESLIRVKLN